MERRLAAILASDVVGYSKLMGSDEAGTLAHLKAHRAELFNPIIAEHNGRIIKLMGDGTLVEFASAVDAVNCALALQSALNQTNGPIRLRIGIELGDIIVEGEDIYGDGVNIAARLEAIAEPNGVCISNIVHQSVQTKINATFTSMGEQNLKNIDKPVRAWRWSEHSTQPHNIEKTAALAPADKPSVAVLPFDNMSGDKEQEYFVDGMVEDIITGLARINWLLVTARNSSFAYKGKPVDIKQAGRELGVRYILEGSARKVSNRVRITGQLIEAETGGHVWAERYDRTFDDIFALQDELTMNVVAAIEPSLRQAEIERVKRKRPDNLDAYDLVLRAIPFVYPAMPEEAAQALPLLEKALELEPDYALAHGFAAWCHEIILARGGGHEENRLGAVRHAHAAIAHGRDDAIALSLGGFAIGMVAHDRDAADQAFEAALSLSSSCALTYILGSIISALAGDADRGIEWGERALRLSPFDPMNYGTWFSIAFGRFQREEYEAAGAAAQKVFQANPYWSTAHLLLAATQIKLGRTDAARAAAARVLELEPGFSISDFCAVFDIHPLIATPLSNALKEAGLPE